MIEKARRAMNDSAAMRWGVVLLVSVGMAVNYYFYDALSPLKEILTTELGWTSSHYGVFVSAYSVPNTFLFMAVIGGMIADKLGIRITGTTFTGMMLVGTILTWYGGTDTFNDGGPGYALLSSFWTGYPPSLKMMFIGFFVFGLGAETSLVVISKTIVKWFRGREVAMALAINLALARLGTALAMIVPPMLIEPDWTHSLWVCVVLMAIGFVTFVFYAFIDAKYDKQAAEAAKGEEEPPFRLSDLLALVRNPSFMFIALLCVTFYSAVFPFLKYAPDLMFNKFDMSLEQSGAIVSMLPFGTIIFTPLFGWIVDYKGKGASLMILGSLLLVAVHLLFSLTNLTPWVPLFVLGVAFSLVPAAMWPSLAKIVDDNRMGTAYGLTFSIQNLGLWGFPILIGMALDGTNPGIADAKEIAAAAAEIREAAAALAEADPRKASAEEMETLLAQAREAAGDLVEIDPSGVDDRYISGFAAARPLAERLAGEENPQAARALASELAGLEARGDRPRYDYTYAVLMLALLGLAGLVFAFLLKAADRRQGYGLDLPNEK
ncbi:MAG: MFS transporter [Polyangia bacterium]